MAEERYLKKINTVEEVEEIAAGDTLALIRDGAIKRIPAEKVGGSVKYDLDFSCVVGDSGVSSYTVHRIITYDAMKNKILSGEPINVIGKFDVQTSGYVGKIVDTLTSSEYASETISIRFMMSPIAVDISPDNTIDVYQY